MNVDDLTDLHLNILVTAYYADGSVRTDDLRDTYRFLVDLGLIRYTAIARQMCGMYLAPSPTLAISEPGSGVYPAVAVTEKGQELVADMGVARKVEACIVMGDIEATKALAGSLPMEELPPLLASDCGFVRDAAKDRLTVLQSPLLPAGNNNGKVYFIDLQGGSIACIKGLSN